MPIGSCWPNRLGRDQLDPKQYRQEIFFFENMEQMYKGNNNMEYLFFKCIVQGQ